MGVLARSASPSPSIYISNFCKKTKVENTHLFNDRFNIAST